jgi:hypothetical protein
MTFVQRVAQIFGVVFLLAALAGFLSAGNSMDPHVMTAPRALGLFPVNMLHNLVHAIFGVWGLLASRGFRASRSYAQVSGVIYILLMVLGYFAPDGFGLMPLGGNDVLLHAFLGIPLAIVGFTAREPIAAQAVGGDRAATTSTTRGDRL